MSVKVGFSIEKDCIGVSVFSTSDSHMLLHYDSIKYESLSSDIRYKKFGKLYEQREITKLLTTLSLSILNGISKKYGKIDKVNFSLLKTELLFSMELAAMRTEKQKVIEILKRIGVTPSYNTITRFKLWEELGDNPEDRQCVYSGKPITISNLFQKNLNIDHIVPHSLTRDNSLANMIVCSKKHNSLKAAMTPWEKWSKNSEEWSGIISRARKLPVDRFWRFSEDAVEISRYMKEKNFHMNTAQLNFSSSLRYLTHEIGIVDSYDNIDFINPIAIKAVKRGVMSSISNFYEDLGNFVSREERATILDSIVCYTVSKKCQSQILSFADRVDKKTFQEEYHDINFSRHNLNTFELPMNNEKTYNLCN